MHPERGYSVSDEYAGHQEKELRQDRIKLNSVAEMMDRVDETREAAAQFYETQMQNNLRFMTQMLKEDHTQEGSYTGPRRFTDGAVVELDGEKVIWPEDMPTDFPKLSADQIRQGDRYQAVIGGENGEGTLPRRRSRRTCTMWTGPRKGRFWTTSIRS